LAYELNPTAAALLDKSAFLVDFVDSKEEDNLIITVSNDLTALTRRIKLTISKWFMNSLPMDIWRSEGLDIKSEKCVLGVDWNTVTLPVH
jgi:hypothetical protein